MQVKRQRHERITRINSKVGRDINRSIILNTIRRHQPISRAEISGITLLNKSTVSDIVAILLSEDLLVESADRGGSVGRTPVNLTVKQGKHFVGAISFDAPTTRIAIVDINGTVKASDEIQTQSMPPDHLVAQCIARITSMRGALGQHRFHGIGASVAGIVDSVQAQVLHAANLGWNNVDLASTIRTHAPDVESVSIENDAKSSALAELLLGTHTLSSSNLIFLLLGAGIGAGITMNGKVLSGSAHAAGEVGHMTVVEGGEPCQCGNAGCWELYASERAPVHWYADAKKLSTGGAATISLNDVFHAARRQDPDAIRALSLWAQHIGVGIGDMISILDPEVVIIGGSITSVWDLISKGIIEAAHGRGTFARQRTTAILPTSLSASPPLIGAASLAIRRIFADFGISG